MHTQHVKFSTYVAWGVGMGGVVAVVLVFEEGKVSGMEEVDDDVDEMVVEVVEVVVVVLVAVVVVVAVVSFISIAPSLSPTTSSLFVPSSVFFLGNGAFFSAAAATATAFNRLHSLLCPPSFQCVIWHSRLQ